MQCSCLQHVQLYCIFVVRGSEYACVEPARSAGLARLGLLVATQVPVPRAALCALALCALALCALSAQGLLFVISWP